MKFSRDWIGEYVVLPPGAGGDGEEFAERLTAAGLAVEYREPEGDDLILDIDITTNRVDAMNHLGLARETSALYELPLRLPDAAPEEIAERTADAVRVSIEDGRCARFVARVVRGVKVGPSPDWLVRRLEAVGARSINNVVDITNYVLWEMGKPIHAYDLATLAGAEIRVRAARQGETLVTLDGGEHELAPELLVIADAERPIGLGGIMGGLDTEVTEKTVDVLIESAHFDPRAVRRGGQRVGINSDARHRFERGVDPEITAVAAHRAALLIQQVAGGEVLADAVDVRFDPDANWVREGRIDLARLNRFMGVKVEPQQVEGWLARLGFELEREPSADGNEQGVAWKVRVPTWRYYDFAPVAPSGLCYEADLFEEVARIHGLDGIPASFPPLHVVEPPRTPQQRARRAVQDHLAATGYAEAINFAFYSPEDLASLPGLAGVVDEQPTALRLANPLSELYSIMRRSLLPGLLASARFNQRRGASAVRLFEVGRVFQPAAPSSEAEHASAASFPEEIEMVGLLAGGELGSPWERGVGIDFYDVKGALESIAADFHCALTFRATSVAGMVEGASAGIHGVARDGGEVGLVGVIGRLTEEEGYPLYAAEMRLDFLAASLGVEAVETASRFPGVAVDLTFTHPLSVPWAEIRQAIDEGRPRDLISYQLWNRYRGEGVPEGAVNTSITFLYTATDRSLTREEVNERHQKLAADLEARFGWKEARTPSPEGPH